MRSLLVLRYLAQNTGFLARQQLSCESSDEETGFLPY